MIGLQDELGTARDAGALAPEPAARLIAIERREVFSIFGELRAASYLSVAIITTGAGIWIKNNADRLGPTSIVLGLLIASAACYAFALGLFRGSRTSVRATPKSIVDDYILLLGALLFGSAVGYAESQWHFFGEQWARHLLILGALHVAVAYVCDSRLILSAALTSIATWFGIERTLDLTSGFGTRALVCAALIFVLRLVNRHRPFDEVYEQFAANLAFWGAIAWAADKEMRWIGVLVAAAVAGLAIWRGLRGGGEALVILAMIYVTIAFDVALVSVLDDAAFFYLLVTTPLAIVVLFVVHSRLKERTA